MERPETEFPLRWERLVPYYLDPASKSLHISGWERGFLAYHDGHSLDASTPVSQSNMVTG